MSAAGTQVGVVVVVEEGRMGWTTVANMFTQSLDQ